MTTQKHSSRKPRPTTATKANGNAQEAQAGQADAHSVGKDWRPPSEDEYKRLLKQVARLLSKLLEWHEDSNTRHVSGRVRKQVVKLWETWDEVRAQTDYSAGMKTKKGCFEHYKKTLKVLGIVGPSHFKKVLDTARKHP